MTESHRRSVAKTISYRVLASLVTTLIAWGMTGRISTGFKIGAIDAVMKLIGYFLHERAWARIKWGQPKPPEYEI